MCIAAPWAIVCTTASWVTMYIVAPWATVCTVCEGIIFAMLPQVQWSSEEVSEPVTSEPVTAVAAVCGRPCDDGCACQHMCCMVGTQLMLWSMGDCNCVQCSLQGCRGNWKLNGQWKQIARVTLAKVSPNCMIISVLFQTL